MRRTHKVFVGYFSTEYPKQHIKNLVGYFCPKARNIVVFRKSFGVYNKLSSRHPQGDKQGAPAALLSPNIKRPPPRTSDRRFRPPGPAPHGLTTCRMRSQMASANDLDMWPIRYSVRTHAVDYPPDTSQFQSEQREAWFCCILFPTLKLADEAIENLREIEIDGTGVITREWIERRRTNERRNLNASRFIDRRTGERRTYSFTLGSK